MSSDCKECEEKGHNCGGHWRRMVIPRGQTTRGKISLDNYDSYSGMFSAPDRDTWDPNER